MMLHQQSQRGQRAYPNQDGILWLAEGEYGYNDHDQTWYIRPPGQHMGSLKDHDIQEHEDGTISVYPSILMTDHENDCELLWHGYLEHGIWTQL